MGKIDLGRFLIRIHYSMEVHQLFESEKFGSEKNIRFNLAMFFVDGILFTPSLALISIAVVIPFFLENLNASTFQIAMAASISMICIVAAQPYFGSIASRATVMSKTFGKILLTQRILFLIFVLSIPLFGDRNEMLIWAFLLFWGIFNIFVGSYSVFYTPLLLKLLPPNKRGGIRGIGLAIGAGLGFIMNAIIPIILRNISFPYNFVVIFTMGMVFLTADAFVFLALREHEDVEPRIPLSISQYISGIPSIIKQDSAFRAMVLTCMFLVVANSLIPLYTVYGIRIFGITEEHIATLGGLAIATSAVGNICFGFLVDRWGTKTTSVINAFLVVASGILAISFQSLFVFYISWVLVNLSVTCYSITVSLLLGDVSPSAKLPLYAGALQVISMALSSTVLLLIAPVLEDISFAWLFVTVIGCGIISLVINLLFLRKHL